ncbi:hypothetical protein [Ornithinimicrobium kibberense]|uniref:hypothetical protein n=1 Tax=Ornithinimicrobium kibberense TaxID=282060 RepID=UPI00361B5293
MASLVWMMAMWGFLPAGGTGARVVAGVRRDVPGRGTGPLTRRRRPRAGWRRGRRGSARRRARPSSRCRRR